MTSLFTELGAMTCGSDGRGKMSSSRLKRKDVVPGFLSAVVTEVCDEVYPTGLIDTHMRHVVDGEVSLELPIDNDSDHVQEVQTLPHHAPHAAVMPNLSYRNLVFVTPNSINFSGVEGHVRNIAVKVSHFSFVVAVVVRGGSARLPSL